MSSSTLSVRCIHSVFYQDNLHAPGTILELPEEEVKRLGRTGSVEVLTVSKQSEVPVKPKQVKAPKPVETKDASTVL